MQVPTFKPFVVLSLLGTLLFFSFGCSDETGAGFELRSPGDLPAGTLLPVDIPDSIACCENLILKAVGSDQRIQLQADTDGHVYFQLEAPLSANTSRQYRLIEDKQSTTAGLELRKTATGLDIEAQGRPLLTYNTATLSPPEGLPDYYQRSGFIHPFYSPGGKVLTDDFPVGHTHQHAIFFAWVNTTYRGDFTDFWNQQKETGTVAFKEMPATGSGPVFADFESRQEHLSLQHGPVLSETWDVRTYTMPEYNVIDLTSRQKIIGTDTLFINKYHYGGMGIRLAAEWNEVDSSRYTGPMQVITSEGITNRDSANHSRPNWTAVYGTLDGATAGLALFDHPANFRFPQPVRVHPSMPYFVLAPMVASAFELVPGEIYTFHYRIVSFDGEPDTTALDAMWQAYANEAELKPVAR